jgi:hypothetical protein
MSDLLSADRRVVLKALQERLAAALDECEPREVAALAKQMAACMAELEGLPGGEADSQVDQVAARRRERQEAARRAAEAGG